MAEARYRTLATPHRSEIPKIRGSRFIASAAPFSGEAALVDVIAGLRREFPEANHHCWAWRHGERFRHADDGEPSGTAGRPLLQQIDGHRLDRTYVVVTRIFGGTLLGAGGLVRAYSAAARQVLDEAAAIEVVPTRRVSVRIAYGDSGTLQSILTARGMSAAESRFGESILQTFHVAFDEVDGFVDELRERTAGRAAIEIELSEAT